MMWWQYTAAFAISVLWLVSPAVVSEQNGGDDRDEDDLCEPVRIRSVYFRRVWNKEKMNINRDDIKREYYHAKNCHHTVIWGHKDNISLYRCIAEVCRYVNVDTCMFCHTIRNMSTA